MHFKINIILKHTLQLKERAGRHVFQNNMFKNTLTINCQIDLKCQIFVDKTNLRTNTNNNHVLFRWNRVWEDYQIIISMTVPPYYGLICFFMLHYIDMLCAIKLEMTYSDPNRAFKVSEIYLRSGFILSNPPPLSVSFHGQGKIQSQVSWVLVCHSLHYNTLGIYIDNIVLSKFLSTFTASDN